MKKLRVLPVLTFIPLLLTGCNVLRYDSYDYSDKYTIIDGRIDFSDEQLDINKIDINWGRGEFIIDSVDSGTTYFTEEDEMELKDNVKARYFISDKTLFIRYAQSKVTYNNKLNKIGHLYLNQSVLDLANITIDCSVAIGSLTANKVKGTSLELSVAYGNINTTDINADSFRSVCDSGTQKHSNVTMRNLGEFKSNKGDIEVLTSNEVVGFTLDSIVVSGTLFVNTTKFPKESDAFYGTHKEKDLQITIVENYGNASIL